jgi:hypothetical protein
MSAPSWLPNLLPFGGSWDEYADKVYGVFEADFITKTASFRGSRIGLRLMPVFKEKPAAFWHLIQEGKVEEDRTPDLRRCERIAWIRAIIDNANDPAVRVWENERLGKGGTRRNVLLWLYEHDFLVVLGKRSGYYLLVTAYPITRPHTRRKLQQEYEGFRASKP